ncbi:MAG: trehalose-phosphatase [Nitriliruptoraceae bacterium]
MSQAPSPDRADPDQLARDLQPVAAWLVVLDFDGTLAPIVDHPDLAQPAPGALDAIAALMARTPVAVVSGRPIADVRRRLKDLPLSYAGGHGTELELSDGTAAPLIDPGTVLATLDAVEAELEALVGSEPGWLLERKQASLAVHHRLATPEDVSALLPRVEALLERRRTDPPGFEVLHGKAVAELRPTGADKGAALRRIHAATPTLRPLMVGDDVTDEDAFVVAQELGGQGILVSEGPRPSAADLRLNDPAEVVRFLAALLGRPTG